MPEYATFISATEQPMAGFMGRLQLLCSPVNVVLSRVGSRAGMPLLCDHAGDMALGMVTRLESRGAQVEGEAALTETARNAEYLEELHAGLRRGISPGFLIHRADAVDDPDFDNELMLRITLWEPYEQSATPVPRNAEAGLLGISSRSATRTSIVPADIQEADIQEKVDREVKRQVSALEDSRDTGAAENAKLEEAILSTTHNTVGQNGKAGVTRQSDTGKDTPGQSERESYKAAFRSMLFGGPEPSGDGVKDFVGQPGKMSTVKLAFDTTTAPGIVTTMGGALVADGFFEESPRRILALPRRIENIAGDLQVPTLATEPNSAMVAQGAARLAVVDATLEAAPPTLSPKRLQTVVDYSMQETLVAPGFEDFILGVMMAASDRQMAIQILTGDGTGQNITGITAMAGVKETEYVATDKGSQASFFSAEDTLSVDTPADRRVWVMAEDLFRTARRTLRDPGSGDYVVRRWDGQMRVLDNSMAIRTNTLPAGVAVHAEWSACTLGLWENMMVTIDRIATPGTLKITLDRYFDFAVTRPARFVVLAQTP